jgi:hypothetical protein
VESDSELAQPLQGDFNYKHCNSLVNFFIWGANIFELDSNENYFRSRHLALPQDSHTLQGLTRDLWTVPLLRDQPSAGSEMKPLTQDR